MIDKYMEIRMTKKNVVQKSKIIRRVDLRSVTALR
ncbi:hypothetical protein BN2476_70055 [Paraburkholderia piptadeniae]|uniref:Uncharacterized protein n=1 Tax=Paraburkholderia piptadeniae TaxID=1701573 RepID=A0A1N7RLC8_9BURK|nr:hypothetical protein BN2476_70055 [Paraburkholderia piptadeniae]